MLETTVRTDMIAAMKAKDTTKKTTLSMLVNALTLGKKEKKADLTPSEEHKIVLKMCKQIQETIDACPPDRTDILEKAKLELETISVYAPKLMNENEIRDTISNIFTKLFGDTKPTKKDKGAIMKVLMPEVNGKADGQMVNNILEEMLM